MMPQSKNIEHFKNMEQKDMLVTLAATKLHKTTARNLV